MTRVDIKYNPYTVESEIKVDGVLVQAPNKLADRVNERLQVWVEDLMPILDETCNDDEYEIYFYGLSLDYNDIVSCITEYCEIHKDISVKFNFTKAKGNVDRFKELVKLFKDMQNNCPFEDLKTKEINDNFRNAVSTNFEVSVIATMSSGKSTLINSMLGEELMPSRIEACTATIVRIKDIDGMDHFEASYYDKEGRPLGKIENLSLKEMTEMNDNPKIAYIDIKGEIPGIKSDDIQLVFVDTPGPDFSRTEEHKNQTYRIIKEKSKPLVLYVLDGTQLEVNDDKELLTAVSNAMKVGGKQSKDRFLFAINKMDRFDPEKDSVQGTLNDAKEYLKGFGIENPNIFPVSAQLAKVIRLYEKGYELTDDQESFLDYAEAFNEDERQHFSEQASLSKDNMARIKGMLDDARESEDEYKEALIHSGVPAIELAINEYIEKYAYTTKIKSGVDAFRKKIEEKDMYSKMMTSIQNDKEARKKVNSQLRKVKKQLEEGTSLKEFKDRINELNMAEQADKRIQALRSRINEITLNKNHKNKMKKMEVYNMMTSLEKRIREVQGDVKTELEIIIDDVINQGCKNIIGDYKKRMKTLISSGDINSGDYSAKCNIDFLEDTIPDTQEIIDQYKHVESFDSGIPTLVSNTRHRWWDIFELFEPRYVTQNLFINIEWVDADKVYEDYVTPIIDGFFKNLDNARKTAKLEADKFKKFFLKELDLLESTLKKKIDENEKLTSNQESLELKLKADQMKIKWLESFMSRLDKIVEI